MVMKKDEKVKVVKKNPTRHKIIVTQDRAMGTTKVPYKTVYTEPVGSKEEAKVREKELREEYKNVDALSVSYFSL